MCANWLIALNIMCSKWPTTEPIKITIRYLTLKRVHTPAATIASFILSRLYITILLSETK